MKKLITMAAASVLLATPVMAAPQGTLLLQGSIGQVLSLDVSAETGVNDQLDLTTTTTDLKVASVNEVSNSNTGYKIFIRTANGGSLKNGSLDQVTYTMDYDGAPVTLSINDQIAKTVVNGGVYNHDSDVEISYNGTPAASLTQGTYSDTVTFTIQVN
ncbi:hypothetical protein A9Q84_16700 [Halobacteriovorax marinus]|uniref:Fimbrial protein n=1 Tax=Halobacteriovorax marinus TaxID=97084 RepID=A0A1Y5FAY7_9BACT|nr:hypothetical protein A9Q84_16700 [Halobacteriovorax marinus]